ncbi:MAG: flagellar protein FlaG [Pseudomonadota bacterium]
MKAITNVISNGPSNPYRVSLIDSPVRGRPDLSIGCSSQQQKDKRMRLIEPDTTERIVESMQRFMNYTKVRLEFQVRKDTGKIVSKVINEESGRVIREIPLKSTCPKAPGMEGALVSVYV